MSVIQLSIFIENKAGRVTEITDALSKADLNIRGFAISDTEDYGIVRVIVDNPEKGAAVLADAGFTVKKTPVVIINLSEDTPGGLAAVLRAVSDAGVNIEYIYSLISTYLAINVKDIDEATRLLEDAGVDLISAEQIARF